MPLSALLWVQAATAAGCEAASRPAANTSSLCSVPGCRACRRLLPQLIIIGSIKAGTSALWSQLIDRSGGVVMSGCTTHKGAISRKEKDFFGDPNQWRRGHASYERIWPRCPRKGQVSSRTPAWAWLSSKGGGSIHTLSLSPTR